MRLPYALGQPSAARTLAKMRFDEISEAEELFALILRRNGDEDGFIEAATEELDFACSNEFLETRNIFRMIGVEPGEKRTRIVQTQAYRRIFFEQIDERKIRSLVTTFENVFKITAGLVRVNNQNQMEGRRHESRRGSHAISYLADDRAAQPGDVQL